MQCAIFRLRHNVIKTGVRMINLSYSRISLTDVADKLTLDSPEDAEFIVAKVTSDHSPGMTVCASVTVRQKTLDVYNCSSISKRPVARVLGDSRRSYRGDDRS